MIGRVSGYKIIETDDGLVADRSALTSASPESGAEYLTSEMVPAVEVTTVYVTEDGDDTNSGLSWHRPKATIQAAIDALPVESVVSPGTLDFAPGTIEIGYGTFTVSSFGRDDTNCQVTSGSPVVLDAAVTADDVGAIVTAVPGQALSWPRASRIISVVPGVSFTMDNNATATQTQPVRIERPGIVIPPGVTLRGRTKPYGLGTDASDGLTHAGTTIEDDGNATTIWIEGASGVNETTGVALERLKVKGNDENTFGLFGSSTNDIRIDQCVFEHHGQWGIKLGQEYYSAYCRLTDVAIQWNGSADATDETGGIAFGAAGWTNEIHNCHITNNYGFNIYLGNAVGNTFVNCDLNWPKLTNHQYSGSAIYSHNSHMNSFQGCWSTGYKRYGLVFDNADALPSGMGIDLEYCTLTSEGNGETSIYTAPGAVLSSIVLRSCLFDSNNSDWSIDNAGGHRIRWSSCTSGDTGFIKQEALVAAYAAAAGVVPRDPTTETLVSGTPWQNTEDADVLLTLPLTFLAGGTAELSRGPAASAYAKAVETTAGVIHYWRFNERIGTIAEDSVGDADATYFAGPTIAQASAFTDPTANSILLDGTNDWVKASPDDLPTGAAPRSIGAWVKRTATGSRAIANFAADAGGEFFAVIACDNGGTFFSNGDIAYDLTASSGWWPLNTWVHTVFAVDGSANWELIINGVTRQSGTFPGPLDTGAVPAVDGLEIGQRGGGEFFKGYLQEVAIYNTAISQVTAAAHYAASGLSDFVQPLGTVTRVAADTDVLEFRVPAGWYFQATLTDASFTDDASVLLIP